MSEKELRKEKVEVGKKEKEAELEKIEREKMEDHISSLLRKEAFNLSLLRTLEEEFLIMFKKELEKMVKNAEYPKWVHEPWARVRPHVRFLNPWYDKWKEVLVIYAKKNMAFHFSITKLLNEWPFSDGEKNLKIEDLRAIVNKLVDDGLARWLSPERKEFVLHWLSTEFLAEKTYETMRKVGLPLLRLSILKEALNDLPQNDLIKILEIIVNKQYGVWVIKGKAIKISAV